MGGGGMGGGGMGGSGRFSTNNLLNKVSGQLRGERPTKKVSAEDEEANQLGVSCFGSTKTVLAL